MIGWITAKMQHKNDRNKIMVSPYFSQSLNQKMFLLITILAFRLKELYKHISTLLNKEVNKVCNTKVEKYFVINTNRTKLVFEFNILFTNLLMLERNLLLDQTLCHHGNQTQELKQKAQQAVKLKQNLLQTCIIGKGCYASLSVYLSVWLLTTQFCQ